ncbi:hypothetical protein [Candidatus Ruthia endofausta]|nr:hypothetical protein [Candidatus Ruthia endofausta]
MTHWVNYSAAMPAEFIIRDLKERNIDE